jgi:hypothetical protein
MFDRIKNLKKVILFTAATQNGTGFSTKQWQISFPRTFVVDAAANPTIPVVTKR